MTTKFGEPKCWTVRKKKWELLEFAVTNVQREKFQEGQTTLDFSETRGGSQRRRICTKEAFSEGVGSHKQETWRDVHDTTKVGWSNTSAWLKRPEMMNNIPGKNGDCTASHEVAEKHPSQPPNGYGITLHDPRKQPPPLMEQCKKEQ